jgi:hypothetical protein
MSTLSSRPPPTMQPPSSRKRKSDQLDMSNDDQFAVDMASQKIPTKGGSPHFQESPSKRQRVGITLAQKQALIDNLQLESTCSAQNRERERDANELRSHRTRPQAPRKLQHPRAKSPDADRNPRQPHPPVPAQAHDGRAVGEVLERGATKTQREYGCRARAPRPREGRAVSVTDTGHGNLGASDQKAKVCCPIPQILDRANAPTAMRSQAETRRTRSRPRRRR